MVLLNKLNRWNDAIKISRFNELPPPSHTKITFPYNFIDSVTKVTTPSPHLYDVINEKKTNEMKYATHQAWLVSSSPGIQLLRDKFQGNPHSPTNESWNLNTSF